METFDDDMKFCKKFLSLLCDRLLLVLSLKFHFDALTRGNFVKSSFASDLKVLKLFKLQKLL